ncbi:hypothetical protein ACLKA6_002879 [Drosophila palustris]
MGDKGQRWEEDVGRLTAGNANGNGNRKDAIERTDAAWRRTLVFDLDKQNARTRKLRQLNRLAVRDEVAAARIGRCPVPSMPKTLSSFFTLLEPSGSNHTGSFTVLAGVSNSKLLPSSASDDDDEGDI